jgi:Zn-dependent oligopeptidase
LAKKLVEKNPLKHIGHSFSASNSKDDAKSLKEIANEMGPDITFYVDWICAERQIYRFLRALARWGLWTLG